MLQIAVHLLLEGRILARLRIGLFQIEDQRHQRLGDETAAEDAEMPGLVGTGAERVGLLDGHALLATFTFSMRACACRAAWTKARILSGVLFARRALDAGGDIDAAARA